MQKKHAVQTNVKFSGFNNYKTKQFCQR